MFHAELGGALRLEIGELAEIIIKTGHATAVEGRPERRFADGRAAGERHAFIIVRRAADHMGVGFDVFHNESANFANWRELTWKQLVEICEIRGLISFRECANGAFGGRLSNWFRRRITEHE